MKATRANNSFLQSSSLSKVRFLVEKQQINVKGDRLKEIVDEQLYEFPFLESRAGLLHFIFS